MTPRLLYFIPAPSDSAVPELLLKRGLGDRFSDMGGRLGPMLDPDVSVQPGDLIPFARTPVKKGPDGGEGVLVSLPQGEGVMFDANAQTWVRFDRSEPLGTIWLGWWNDAKPGPKSLQRANPLHGYGVTLGDGNDWIVPVAKLLPASRTWDGTAWTTKQRPAYAILWHLSNKLLATYWEPLEAWMEMAGALREKDEKAKAAKTLLTVPEEEEERWAAIHAAYNTATTEYDPMDTVRILSVNHRVGPEEVSALELIDVGAATGHDWAIVNALVDGNDVMLARAKKNGAAGG